MQATHWAATYAHDTWEYRVACYIVGATETHAIAVANIARGLPAAMRSVWHANHLFNQLDPKKCPCAPCQRPPRSALEG